MIWTRSPLLNRRCLPTNVHGITRAAAFRARYGLTEGRVRTVDADPGMDYQARVDLAAELCPDLPAAAIHRIGQRTRTFAEVFAVVSAERLAELDAQGDYATTVAVADEVIDAQVNRVPPSRIAVLLAWAGGIMHARQAERAVKVLGEGHSDDDRDVVRFESLIRLTDPASSRLAEQVRVLTASKRRAMAEIVLDTALEIGDDPGAGLVDKVVAWQAAHRVRADLQNHAQLVGMQRQLVHGLENLDDPSAAYQVATEALAESLANEPGQQLTPEQDGLAVAVLRLTQTQQSRRADPLIDAMIGAATAAGALTGLEARIWTTIDLLSQPGQRARALELTDQITAELNSRHDLGAIGNRWRLLLAFHVGRAGYPAIAQQLLTPLLAESSPPEDGVPRERCCMRSPDHGRIPGCRSPASKQNYRRCRPMLTTTACAFIMLSQPTIPTWVTTVERSIMASRSSRYVAAYKAPTTPIP